MTTITATLQSFFTDRLLQQRQASPHTIASYRDTIRLLLGFLQSRTGKPPSRLDWADLNPEAIAAFLDHLETDRHNSARTRNLRLTAVRSLFAYASLRHPEHADLIARVLAIPPKRFDKATIAFLDDTEVAALLAAPDRTRWEGRRDRTLILLAIQTGLRVSELLGLHCSDITPPVRTCDAEAKAASRERSRSPAPSRQPSVSGSPNAADCPTTRSSAPGPDAASAPTPSNAASPCMRRPPRNDARH